MNEKNLYSEWVGDDSVEDRHKYPWYQGRSMYKINNIDVDPISVVNACRAHILDAAHEGGPGLHYLDDDGGRFVLRDTHSKLLGYLENTLKARRVVSLHNRHNGMTVQATYVWADGACWITTPAHDIDEDELIADYDDADFGELNEDENPIEDLLPDTNELLQYAVASRVESDIIQFVEIVTANAAPSKPYVHKNPGTAYILANIPMRGLEVVPLGLAGEDLIRENYMPDVIEKFDFVVADLHRSEPFGRLTILEGEPGCGKTHMVQAFMKACPKSKFITIPPKMLPDLEDPGFVLTFVREMNHTNGAAPLVLVLEDADQVITERNMSNMSSISAVLNLSDGIVGKLLNLRILATSNTKVGASGFDSAALRKGRLTAHIKVGKLDASFANRVFQRLTGTEKAPFGRAETLADIYNGAKEFMTTVEKNV